MTTVNVSVELKDQNGLPHKNAIITSILTRVDVDAQGEYVIPEQKTWRTDSHGIAVLQLWPNALGTKLSRYHITGSSVRGNVILDVFATVPIADVNLADIAEDITCFEGCYDASGGGATGDIADAIQAHEAKPNPHPQYILNTEKGVSIPTLEQGRVPQSQLPSSLFQHDGSMMYKGDWNADTNAPDLTNNPQKGDTYRVSVEGDTVLNGISTWNVGDIATFNGTAWERIDSGNVVFSVNGKTGIVIINAGEIPETNSAKIMTGEERTKLAGIADQATKNEADSYLLDRSNHTGMQSADTIVDGQNNKVFTAGDANKLDGIEAQATKNESDTHLLNRSNHTGEQETSTITGLDSALLALAQDIATKGNVSSDNSSEANQIALFADATGKKIKPSDLTIEDGNRLSGHIKKIVSVSGSSVILNEKNHSGTVILCGREAGSTTILCPTTNDSLSPIKNGFYCDVVQMTTQKVRAEGLNDANVYCSSEPETTKQYEVMRLKKVDNDKWIAEVNAGSVSDGTYQVYSNSTPTPSKVGNVPAGTTFESWDFMDLMERLFYPQGGQPTMTEAYNFVFDDINDGDTLTVGDFADGILGKAEYPAGTSIIITSINGGQSTTGDFAGDNGGKFTINANGTFAFDTESDFEALPQGDTLDTGIWYSIMNLNDLSVSQGSIIVRVTGTNKAPFVVGNGIPNQTKESTDSININLSLYFDDVNEGEKELLIYSIKDSSLPASLSIDGDRLIGTLANDDHTTSNSGTAGKWNATIRAADVWGATADSSFTFTINRPSISASDKSFTITADQNKIVSSSDPLSLLSGITGKDTSGLHIVSVNGQPMTSAGVTVSSGIKGELTVNEDGSYQFETQNEFDNVLQGSTDSTVSVSYVVANAQGASSQKAIKPRVQGTLVKPTQTTAPALTSFSVTVTDGDASVVGNKVTIKTNAVFNKGRIDNSGTNSDSFPVTGKVTKFSYTGDEIAGDASVSDDTDSAYTYSQERTGFDVVVADTALQFTATASYEEGAQPKDSRGNNDGSPYPAGTSNTRSASLPAASQWKWYATTGTNPQTMTEGAPFALSSLPYDADGYYHEFIMSGKDELDTNAIYGFAYPKDWEVKGIKFQGIGGVWDWQFGGQPVSLQDLSKTLVQKMFNGVGFDYYQYVNTEDNYETNRKLTRIYFER